ncbi:MAG: 3-oxoacyl-ACP reductase FabG [Candidatus Riflebacteria bacterium]|nr:3-oxoacyl-ACP reductase FabG [Candidatus Riflebacteria bacterium]
MRMKEKVVMITGGASGIGKETARRFVEEGARVCICDLDENKGQETVKELGKNVSFRKVNVGNRGEVQAWADEVAKTHGKIDVMINNAGILRDCQLVKTKDGQVVKQLSEEDFDLVIGVNLKGVYNCTQAVVPQMISQNEGVILNTSSIVGEDGNFGQTNYVASKAGVLGMTKVWTRELGKHNIRVNSVLPGFTATEILHAVPEKVLDAMKAKTPLGRLGNPRDIANAFLFLASEEAAFISGVALRVDGGIVVGT